MRLEEKVLEGWVSHDRNDHVEHRFRYPIWMTLADMSATELPRLVRPNWAGYPSRADVLDLAGADARDRVLVLTQPSLLRRSFNPVSFYFIERDGVLRTVIAQITNTPWDEQHCYVLDARSAGEWEFDKEFHVSPFMPMALQYRWRISLERDRVLITMQLLDRGHRVFVAALNLQPVPVSRRGALALRVRYPLQNLRTLSRIYWQALVLKLKGARFHAHPKHDLAQVRTSHAE